MKFHALSIALLAGLLFQGSLQADDSMQPLNIELPKPLFAGTPKPVSNIPNLEAPSTEARKPIMVPKGTKLISSGKPVSSSDDWPIIGEIDFLTDGDKEGEEGYYVELGPDVQWAQIDLEKEFEIQAVVIWHYHAEARVYHDVIVEISNDPEFKEGVTIVYNNDHDNSSGKGVGADLAYVETNEGRLVQVNGVSGRYVRLSSNGNTSNRMNHYVEVEVYGRKK